MKTQEEIEQLFKKYCNNVSSSERLAYIDGYTQCQQDMADISKVTRFEVIDEHGRAYTYPYCKVELSYQDDGRTLKVFIKPLKQD
jgi:hypothetical protein